MAWISVYQEVDGPKLRKLKKALGTSKAEALGILNFLWFWGMNNADETGMVLEADVEDIADAFSSATDIPVDKVTEALVVTGWLDIDEEGRICIHDWDTWQEEWYAAKRRRLHNTEKKRKERAAERERKESGEGAPPENPETPPVEPPEEGLGPPEPPAPPPKPPKKPRKESKESTEEKKKYADYVSMTESNYNALVSKYGTMFADECISILDNYKGSKGKAYKDDYRAILSWVVDKCKEKNPNLLRISLESQKTSNEENPFKEWEDDD